MRFFELQQSWSMFSPISSSQSSQNVLICLKLHFHAFLHCSLHSLPAPPSFNVTLIRLLLLDSRGLGSTHSQEHLHLVICHVRSFSQFPHLHRLQSLKFLALSELDIHGKELRENMHKDIVAQSLRRQDVSKEVISIHDRLQWLHYYIFWITATLHDASQRLQDRTYAPSWLPDAIVPAPIRDK